jgi:hypothetical protein
MRFFLLLLCFVFSTTAMGQVDQFEFQPAKIKTGVVYHYVKTNIDGTHPENISVYVASSDRLEVFKFHEPGTRAGLVVAQMDWKNFQAATLSSYGVFSATEQILAAQLKFDAAAKKMEVEIPAQDRPLEIIDFDYLPTHLYNFDLTSLNFAFRHLKNPASSFTIGLADPTFAQEGPGVRYRGEAMIRYTGDEKRNGHDCRKYSIGGAGLENRNGFLWVNKQGEHFEDLEIELPDNPDWTTFKLNLKRMENMSPDQWSQFQKNHWKTTK